MEAYYKAIYDLILYARWDAKAKGNRVLFTKTTEGYRMRLLVDIHHATYTVNGKLDSNSLQILSTAGFANEFERRKLPKLLLGVASRFWFL